MAQRKRERIRRKALVADSTTALDLTNVKPIVPLKARGKALWQHFAADTPFWWNTADIPSLAILCTATDMVAASQTDGTSAAGKAALIKEWRSLAGELGMSPTSRGRLRLTEAQSTVAAKKVETLEQERRRQAPKVIDIEDLVGDG